MNNEQMNLDNLGKSSNTYRSVSVNPGTPTNWGTISSTASTQSTQEAPQEPSIDLYNVTVSEVFVEELFKIVLKGNIKLYLDNVKVTQKTEDVTKTRFDIEFEQYKSYIRTKLKHANEIVEDPLDEVVLSENEDTQYDASSEAILGEAVQKEELKKEDTQEVTIKKLKTKK